MLLEPIRVAKGYQLPAISAGNTHELAMMDELPALHCSELLPDVVERGSLGRAEQIMDAAIEHVIFSFPGSTKPTRELVKLEYFGALAVHLGITTGR